MKITLTRVYVGKWYIALRFANDLCVGIGNVPQWMRDEAVRERAHRGI